MCKTWTAPGVGWECWAIVYLKNLAVLIIGLLKNMVALTWLLFAMAGTVQGKFPRPEHLKQYMTGKRLVSLNRLHIKIIPENAFRNYSDITVRITK